MACSVRTATLCIPLITERMKQKTRVVSWGISLPVVAVVLVFVCLVGSSLLHARMLFRYHHLESRDEYHRNEKRKSPRVLIAQYCGGEADPYTILLNMTQLMNEHYAARWGYDYYALRGPPEGLAQAMTKTNVSISGSRSTYFKVQILDSRIRQGVYDILVLLDADAMFYDFDRDIVDLIPPDKLLVAHKVNRNDSDTTSLINIGVTIWNLRQPLALEVSRQWQERCLQRIQSGRLDDDQKPLQELLKYGMSDRQREELILAVSEEFAYGHGTFIKHFIRRDHNDWDLNKSLERRVQKIEQASTEVCHRYSLQC